MFVVFCFTSYLSFPHIAKFVLYERSRYTGTIENTGDILAAAICNSCYPYYIDKSNFSLKSYTELSINFYGAILLF